MHNNKKRCLFLSLAALAMIVCLSLAAAPASASSGISLAPFASLVVDVTPGERLTYPMVLTLGDQDQAMDMAVDVMGFGSSLDGSPQGLTAVQDTGPYSARSFISVDQAAFHLAPGGSQNVTATIVVPADVGAGGRYAILYFHQQQPAGGAGAGSVSAFNIPVLLTIKSSTLIHTGKISAVSAGKAVSGQAITILTDFLNTGNHHFKVQGEVTVKDAQGQTLDTLSIPLTALSILPGATRQLQAAVPASSPLAVGSYTADSRVMAEDGTLLDAASQPFEVTAQSMPSPTASGTLKPTPSSPSTGAMTQSVPAPAAATSQLTPTSASTLQNADGTISIDFPQGAAVTSVEVSLKNYSADQLPALPSGIAPASTCFQVEGLTGLLAKEATVTVKYSAADLNQAGGDASKLKLARWDQGATPWTLLKTNVDAGTMTLSAASNQMSTWAVVVDLSPAGAGWEIPAAIAAGVVVVAVAAIFLVVPRRGKGKPVK